MSLALGSISLGATACDQCREEAIPVVTLPATIDFQGQSTAVQFMGSVTSGNIEPAVFNTVRSFLTGPGAGAAMGVVWTVDAQSPSPLSFIAVQLTGPLDPGQDVAVTSAFDGGGWGLAFDQTPAIAVSGDAFTAATAQGTLHVLAISPLRLALDVLTTDAAGEELRIRGEMEARSVEQTFCD
jgi:hypothetical protein